MAITQELPPASRERSAGSTTQSDDSQATQKPTRFTSHPSVAAIGSIDIDAVLKRYEKVQQSHEPFKADMKTARERRAQLQQQAATAIAGLQRLAPGSPDLVALEDRATDLKKQRETEHEKVEREFNLSQARTMAALGHLFGGFHV